jgi:hypothetical protein
MSMLWTIYMDMYTHSFPKTDYEFIFVMADRERAREEFKKRFGIDPEESTPYPDYHIVSSGDKNFADYVKKIFGLSDIFAPTPEEYIFSVRDYIGIILGNSMHREVSACYIIPDHDKTLLELIP